MKQYKIVEHHISPTEHMFRIYKRENIFFWRWVTSFSTIDKCEKHIYWIKASEIQEKARKDNTPKSKTVAYL